MQITFRGLDKSQKYLEKVNKRTRLQTHTPLGPSPYSLSFLVFVGFLEAFCILGKEPQVSTTQTRAPNNNQDCWPQIFWTSPPGLQSCCLLFSRVCVWGLCQTSKKNKPPRNNTKKDCRPRAAPLLGCEMLSLCFTVCFVVVVV